ncbi:TPA: replication protein [Yersinia enterocolitica]|nr:replication protein [Yersinia enterocolitica]
MSNAIDYNNNVSPIRPHLEVVERRVADTDDGYTRIANELLEAIAGADLTARQLKVMIAVIRKTYGYQKKLDRIADIQIADITGLSRQNVNKAKKELLSMNCLMIDGSKIGPNKDLSEWQFNKCLQKGNFVSNLKTKSVSKLETVKVSKVETHKRNTLKIKENTPLTPQGGGLEAAQECLDYYNQITNSRCSATAVFEKALSTVKAKGRCYTADEIKLVIRWTADVWKFKPKPENICRMTRFDSYLSDALVWEDGTDRNPVPCPHEKLLSLWNEKFPERPVEKNEWNKTRPAYRNLERVWNIKTNKGSPREVHHMAMIFDLIRRSSLCQGMEEKNWLNIDWILKPEKWASVYEQAKAEYKNRKGMA